MNARDPRVAWSIEVSAPLDDRARDALSDDLGLSFHGVDAPHAYTIAHRFLDDQDTLLRIVQTRPDHYAAELVGFGSEVERETASEYERTVSDALARLSSKSLATSPLVERFSERLAAFAAQLSATLLLPATLRPIEVLGESPEAEAGPYELMFSPEAERQLGSDIRKRVVFDGSVVRVWISGSWDLPEQSRIVLYAVNPLDELVSAEVGVEQGVARLRLEMPWPHSAPPTDVLLAVMPDE
jgi:hypothetical protein